jgi:hypothetical protein
VRLHLTRRALSDLGLDVDEHAGRPADELADLHPLIAAFVERRRQRAEGQETIQLPRSRAIVYSLHSGRWRGLTWSEADLNIVWLLGAGYHRSGERTDAYAELKARDEIDELFPTEQDYLDFESDPADFAAAVARDAPRLIEAARARIGEEINGELGGALDVFVLVRGGEVWVGFAMPPKAEVPPYPEWLLVALAALLPDADQADIRYGEQFPRPGGTKYGEQVVCWYQP